MEGQKTVSENQRENPFVKLYYFGLLFNLKLVTPLGGKSISRTMVSSVRIKKGKKVKKNFSSPQFMLSRFSYD